VLSEKNIVLLFLKNPVLSTLVCCWFFICQSIDSQFVVANEQVIGGLKMLGMIQFFSFISEY